MIEAKRAPNAETRLVCATWGELNGSPKNVIDVARRKILKWVASRSSEALPAEAIKGEAFSLALGHGEVVSDGGLWAIRFDTVDDSLREETGIERRWRTEAVLADLNDRAIFTLRLSVITAAAGVPFFRSSPALVRELSSAPGILIDGYLSGDAGTSLSGTELFSFLVKRDRRPVIAVADDENGQTPVDVDALRSSCVGFAHVVRVKSETSWEITRAFGRKWSVFNGALRLYGPGVDMEQDNYRDHPIWLRNAIPTEQGELRRFQNRIADRLLSASVSRPDLDELAPGYSSIASHLGKLRLSKASRIAREAREAVEAAKTSKDRISAQQRQIDAMRAEQDGLQAQVLVLTDKVLEISQDRDLAYDVNRELEQEVDRLKAQVFGISAKSRALEEKLREKGVESVRRITPLTSYEEIEGWAETYLPDRLVVLPKAARAAKKSEYEDLGRITECISLLAFEYVDMRRGIEGALDLFREECGRIRVEVSPVGEALQNHRYRQQFTAPYQRGSIELDLHLAPAPGTAERGSYDPKKTFRIYFSWDQEQEIVVVGSLPAHLTTSLTN